MAHHCHDDSQGAGSLMASMLSSSVLEAEKRRPCDTASVGKSDPRGTVVSLNRRHQA